METVQGGVPPYGVKESLVVNGKWFLEIRCGEAFYMWRLVHYLVTNLPHFYCRYQMWRRLLRAELST